MTIFDVKKNSGDISPQQTRFFSLQGRKPAQEDSFYISESLDGKRLIFVADGVGGHGHGDFASQTTVEVFKTAFNSFENFNNVHDFLQKTVEAAATVVLNKSKIDPSYKNCGTTLSGFFINENTFHTVNVGDSRVYLYNREGFKQVTKDHSVVQDLLDNKIISEQEARTHPQRHIMTSAIGQSLTLMKTDILGPFNIEAGEMLFAFTDGVFDVLTDNDLKILIEKHKDSEHLAKFIVEASYEAGSTDNITACIYRHF